MRRRQRAVASMPRGGLRWLDGLVPTQSSSVIDYSDSTCAQERDASVPDRFSTTELACRISQLKDNKMRRMRRAVLTTGLWSLRWLISPYVNCRTDTSRETVR